MLPTLLDESMNRIGLAAFGLVLLGLFIGAAGLVWRQYFGSRSLVAVEVCLLLLMAFILVALGLIVAGQVSNASLRYGLRLGLVVAVVIGLPWVMSRSQPRGAARMPIGLVLVGLAAAGLLTFRFTEMGQPQLFQGVNDGALVAVRDARAYTDAGTPIRLLTRVGAQETSDEVLLRMPSLLDHQPYTGRVIQVGPPDSRTLCHSWTFCGGRYMLFFEDVERIVRENGYREVEQPQPGDLVVYWDPRRGIIVHSGVVKAVGKEKYALVESKWALGGRYLHEPKLQPYSTDFVYYRSDRPGHLLLGLRLEPDAPPSIAFTPGDTTSE